jgi:hypothetical protein
MERYFDAHLYLTNWGTRELMLRLPKGVLDPTVVNRYCVGESASAWTSGKHLIIRLNREDEDGTGEWDIGGEGLLTSIIPVRSGLAAGDVRLLYLGWLRCVLSEELADDDPEPPVPAGLAKLDAPLTAATEFLCIDPDLIAAAAAGSSNATAAEPTAAQLRAWVTQLPARDKDSILARLITGEDTYLRSELLRRYRDVYIKEAPTTTARGPSGNCSPPPRCCAPNGNAARPSSANATGTAGRDPQPPPGKGTSTTSRSTSRPRGSGSTSTLPRRSHASTTRPSNSSSTSATSPNAMAAQPGSGND